MEKFDYITVDVGSIVNRIPEKSKDNVPFGLIKLDKTGKVLEYNMAQAMIAGISPEQAIGQNFFLDLAVCTQRPEFFGKFKEGVDLGLLNTVFDFTFDLRMSPTRVRVHMVLVQGFVYLMVKKLNASTESQSVAKAGLVDFTVPAKGLESRPDTVLVDQSASPFFDFEDANRAAEHVKVVGKRIEDFKWS